MSERIPAPPSGLKRNGRGRALWKAVLGPLDLDPHERFLLHEACRCADLLDDLAAELVTHGMVTADGRPSPLLVEVRQQRAAFARLIAGLRLPEDLAAPQRRPQRRGGARGVYAVPTERRGESA